MTDVNELLASLGPKCRGAVEHDTLERLIELWLVASDADRRRIHERAADSLERRCQLLAVGNRAVAGVKNGDLDALQFVLAAYAIEGNGTDWRDNLLALRWLAEEARHAGLDPRPVFVKIAELAGDLPYPGGTSLREFFLHVG